MTKRFSELCERNMDTITAALHQAAIEVENVEVDGYHVAVSIDAEGNVHTFPCPYGTIPPSVRDGGELIIRRFVSGAEFAPASGSARRRRWRRRRPARPPQCNKRRGQSFPIFPHSSSIKGKPAGRMTP